MPARLFLNTAVMMLLFPPWFVGRTVRARPCFFVSAGFRRFLCIATETEDTLSGNQRPGMQVQMAASGYSQSERHSSCQLRLDPEKEPMPGLLATLWLPRELL